jgi:hypothetical protein
MPSLLNCYQDDAYYAGLDADRLRADNKRLRAALQSLLTDPPTTLDEPDTDAEVVIKMREIARAALASA